MCRGEVISSLDDGVLTLKWKDKRDVLMLSTYHDSSMVTKSRRSRAAEEGVEDVQKPKVVEDYNQNMGGVDKSKFASHVACFIDHLLDDETLVSLSLFAGDQLVLYCGFSHRSVKW